MPPGRIIRRYMARNRVEVSRLRVFFICGSGKVIHISSTSPGAKKRSMFSISQRRNAALSMPDSSTSRAPVHILAPFMSMPTWLREESLRASPTVYSPRPHPSSSTMGRGLEKTSPFHLPT